MKELSPYWWYQLKWYKYWVLYLHPNQYPYLGRCYAASIRVEPHFSNATWEELNELSLIIEDWERAVKSIFEIDFWHNLAIFGNDWPQNHAHFIPRYSQGFEFGGVWFEDPRPGRCESYSPYPKKKLPEVILLEMKLKFLEALS